MPERGDVGVLHQVLGPLRIEHQPHGERLEPRRLGEQQLGLANGFVIHGQAKRSSRGAGGFVFFRFSLAAPIRGMRGRICAS
jgi:hypothetical protein